jgi:hypothetical protein
MQLQSSSAFYMDIKRPVDFVGLPSVIHYSIAQVLDPTIVTGKVSRTGRPDRTLLRLSRVCRRLYHEYSPFSTWKYIFLEARSIRSTRHLGQPAATTSLSPVLKRILDNPDLGNYARELWVQYDGFWKNGFVDAFFESFNFKTEFDRFLACTPRLRSVYCVAESSVDVEIPLQLLRSLSSLSELDSLYFRGLDISGLRTAMVPVPPFHQVRSLRLVKCTGFEGLTPLLRSTSALRQLEVYDEPIKPVAGPSAPTWTLPRGTYDMAVRALHLVTSVEENAKTLRAHLIKLVVELPTPFVQVVGLADFLSEGRLRELVVRLHHGNVEELKSYVRERLPDLDLFVII